MANLDNLVERERAWARLAQLLDALGGGRGGVVTVRGAVGLGRSTLLDHATAAAEGAGVAVRRFRSNPAERSHAWGGCRGLLGGCWRPPTGPPDSGALAGVTSELDARTGGRPILLVVDDAQWLDPQTLRWLHFVGRRLEERAVALVVSCRPGMPATDLAELLALGATVDLEPLTGRGVAELVRRRLGEPRAGFVDRCLELTGGNTFLVGSLLDAVAERGLPADATALDHLGEAPPRRVIDAVRLRLARLPDDVAAIAGAAAVAGRHSSIPRLCELTGRAPAEVTAAVAELHEAGLLGTTGTPAFIHPLEANAALSELSPTTVEHLHRRMAEALHDLGAEDVEIARHLEHCGPIGAPWATLALRRAGERSAHAGDHPTAVRWLRRALEESADPGTRSELLRVLGRSELAVGLPAGIGRLRTVSDESGDPADRLRLARVLALHGHLHEAAAELDDLLATTDGPVRDEVLRQQLATLRQSVDLRPRSRALIEELTVDSDARGQRDPALLAELAYEHALAGTGRDLVAELAGRAMEGAAQGALGGTSIHVLFLSLVWAGELRAAHHLVQLRDRDGDLEAVQHHRRGQLALAVGAVEQAHAHGVAALQSARFDAPVIVPAAVAQLVRSQVRLGELDDAERLLGTVVHEARFRELATFHSVLLARAELALARSDWDDALAASDACRRFSERMGTENPVVMPWHTVAAEALVALDRVDEGQEVASDALARIDRFGYAPDELRRPLERIHRTADAEHDRSVRSHPSRSAAPVAPATSVQVLRILGTSRLQFGCDDTVLGTDLPDRALRFLGLQRTTVHRDVLVEALWPEVEAGVGRARLRKVLSQLRQRHGEVLDTSGELVGLASGITVDVREFRRHAFEAINATDDETGLRSGCAALEWYGGELCELDRYEDWATDVREAVRQEWSTVSHLLAERWAAQGEYERALTIVEQLIADEPWNEAHFTRGARWLARAGRRSGALALIERARAAAAELGVPPSPELDDLEADLVPGRGARA